MRATAPPSVGQLNFVSVETGADSIVVAQSVAVRQLNLFGPQNARDTEPIA